MKTNHVLSILKNFHTCDMGMQLACWMSSPYQFKVHKSHEFYSIYNSLPPFATGIFHEIEFPSTNDDLWGLGWWQQLWGSYWEFGMTITPGGPTPYSWNRPGFCFFWDRVGTVDLGNLCIPLQHRREKLSERSPGASL